MPEYTQRIHEILDEAEHQKPSNEAQVCQCVIVPILEALGYSKWEIKPQAADAGKQYPDYTIMCGDTTAWYLEAKAWNVRLQDPHVNQALNYANQNGQRWVVLTNGHDWRLYDNHIQGTADRKLVVKATAERHPDLLDLLGALSRQRFGSDLDAYAKLVRLRLFLRDQLSRPDSDLLRQILSNVRRLSGISLATTADLATAFATLQGFDGPPNQGHEEPKPSEVHALRDQSSLPETPAEQVPPDGAHSVTLRSLAAGEFAVTGISPRGVHLPGDSFHEANSWADLAQVCTEWIISSCRLPALPFKATAKAKRCFLNHQALHPDGKRMKGMRKVTDGSRDVYIDTNRSAEQMVQSLMHLCEAVKISPDDISVVI